MLARAFFFVLLLTGSSLAQESVHVRLIDGQTGRSLTNAWMMILTYRNYSTGGMRAKEVGDELTLTLSGEWSIGLEGVLSSKPPYIDYVPCASGVNLKPIFAISEIKAKGVVVPNECSKTIGALPTQGEIIFYVRRMTLWEKVRSYRLPS